MPHVVTNTERLGYDVGDLGLYGQYSQTNVGNNPSVNNYRYGASYNNVLGVPMDLKAHISNYDRGANIEYSDGRFTAGANVNKRNNAKNMDYSVYAKYAF